MPIDLAGRRVLIVEDEFLIGMELSEYITKLHGEVIGPVARLNEAIALIEAGGIDYALVDVMLRGRERADPAVALLRERKIPYLRVTAYTDEDLGAHEDGERILRKPFTLEALDRAIGKTAFRAS